MFARCLIDVVSSRLYLQRLVINVGKAQQTQHAFEEPLTGICVYSHVNMDLRNL